MSKQRNNSWSPRHGQPKVRSWVAVAAWNASGAGTHNPYKGQQRRDRRDTKVALRRGNYEI
jgi:hypothetical protein